MSRILVISDIHGYTEGVRILLDQAGYVPGSDELFLLGDFIDYDPTTWKALKDIRELIENGAKAILGNLEQWLLSRKKDKEIPNEYLSDLELLERLPFYLLQDSYLFVHAGLRPGISLEKQLPSDLTGIRQEFWNSKETFMYSIVFGHTPTHLMGAKPGELWHASGKLGIDTGAKHGFRLTLVDINGRISYSVSTSRNNLYGDFRQTVCKNRKENG